MNTYKSDNGKTSFQFQNEGYLNTNGTKTFKFSCSVESFDFTAKLSEIWFYDADLAIFSKELVMLANCELSTIKLAAMSDFELVIKQEDSFGHFEVSIKLENILQRNIAYLTTSLSTQSLFDFANEIESTLQISKDI